MGVAITAYRRWIGSSFDGLVEVQVRMLGLQGQILIESKLLDLILTSHGGSNSAGRRSADDSSLLSAANISKSNSPGRV